MADLTPADDTTISSISDCAMEIAASASVTTSSDYSNTLVCVLGYLTLYSFTTDQISSVDQAFQTAWGADYTDTTISTITDLQNAASTYIFGAWVDFLVIANVDSTESYDFFSTAFQDIRSLGSGITSVSLSDFLSYVEGILEFITTPDSYTGDNAGNVGQLYTAFGQYWSLTMTDYADSSDDATIEEMRQALVDYLGSQLVTYLNSGVTSITEDDVEDAEDAYLSVADSDTTTSIYNCASSIGTSATGLTSDDYSNALVCVLGYLTSNTFTDTQVSNLATRLGTVWGSDFTDTTISTLSDLQIAASTYIFTEWLDFYETANADSSDDADTTPMLTFIKDTSSQSTSIDLDDFLSGISTLFNGVTLPSFASDQSSINGIANYYWTYWSEGSGASDTDPVTVDDLFTETVGYLGPEFVTFLTDKVIVISSDELSTAEEEAIASESTTDKPTTSTESVDLSDDDISSMTSCAEYLTTTDGTIDDESYLGALYCLISPIAQVTLTSDSIQALQAAVMGVWGDDFTTDYDLSKTLSQTALMTAITTYIIDSYFTYLQAEDLVPADLESIDFAAALQATAPDITSILFADFSDHLTYILSYMSTIQSDNGIVATTIQSFFSTYWSVTSDATEAALDSAGKSYLVTNFVLWAQDGTMVFSETSTDTTDTTDTTAVDDADVSDLQTYIDDLVDAETFTSISDAVSALVAMLEQEAYTNVDLSDIKDMLETSLSLTVSVSGTDPSTAELETAILSYALGKYFLVGAYETQAVGGISSLSMTGEIGLKYLTALESFFDVESYQTMITDASSDIIVGDVSEANLFSDDQIVSLWVDLTSALFDSGLSAEDYSSITQRFLTLTRAYRFMSYNAVMSAVYTTDAVSDKITGLAATMVGYNSDFTEEDATTYATNAFSYAGDITQSFTGWQIAQAYNAMYSYLTTTSSITFTDEQLDAFVTSVNSVLNGYNLSGDYIEGTSSDCHFPSSYMSVTDTSFDSTQSLIPGSMFSIFDFIMPSVTQANLAPIVDYVLVTWTTANVDTSDDSTTTVSMDDATDVYNTLSDGLTPLIDSTNETAMSLFDIFELVNTLQEEVEELTDTEGTDLYTTLQALLGDDVDISNLYQTFQVEIGKQISWLYMQDLNEYMLGNVSDYSTLFTDFYTNYIEPVIGTNILGTVLSEMIDQMTSMNNISTNGLSGFNFIQIVSTIINFLEPVYEVDDIATAFYDTFYVQYTPAEGADPTFTYASSKVANSVSLVIQSLSGTVTLDLTEGSDFFGTLTMGSVYGSPTIGSIAVRFQNYYKAQGLYNAMITQYSGYSNAWYYAADLVNRVSVVAEQTETAQDNYNTAYDAYSTAETNLTNGTGDQATVDSAQSDLDAATAIGLMYQDLINNLGYDIYDASEMITSIASKLTFSDDSDDSDETASEAVSG